ncbi:MAG: PEP-CTERM sorting domain-containing protein [Betaproteobacteria bacterium]|nr:PEP-CTERM sorting domain-containing protein [Betaproteobacteria bacterium]
MKSLVKYLSAAATAAMVMAAPSHAVLISSGDPYAFNWSYNSAAGALTGNGTLTVSGFNSNSLTVGVTLTNTSALNNNRLTSFGFGIDPDATSVSFVDANDGGMVGASMAIIPSLATIEVCAFGGNNCPGGGNGGIFGNGGSDTFSLVLAGSWGSFVNIDPIGFKYQTGQGSYEFTTGGGVPPTTTQTVPEPSMFALMGLGLLAFALGKRKRIA